jgi:hypothetical protein
MMMMMIIIIIIILAKFPLILLLQYVETDLYTFII